MRRLSLLLAAVAAFGCSDKVVDPTLDVTDADVVGTFTLTLANGRPLPVVARVTTAEEWDITGDQFAIANDSTWIDTTTYRVTSFSDASVTTQQTTASGTYSISKGQINFVMKTGGTATFTGSVSGKWLTLLYNGGQFFFTR